jgi:nitrite reductase/ring-hydroxylating ferredoxin subunit
MTEFRRVADVNDILPGNRAVVEVDDMNLAIFNVEVAFYATDSACPHRGGPLGEGSLYGTTVSCPWHGSQFDVTNGNVLGPPASIGVTSYSTKVEDGGVWVAIP